MKKGIVMELHRNYTIIMTKEGSFLKAKPCKNGVIIGEEVAYEPLEFNKRHISILHSWRMLKTPVKTFFMTCVILLILLPLYMLSGERESYAYVTLDINPSIEMEVNEQFNVQTIRALNDEALLIMDQLPNYQDELLEEVIGRILDISEQTGLVNDEKNMIVGFSYADGVPDQNSIIPLELEVFFQSISGWEIATLLVPQKIREQAKEESASMNEVMALKILEKDASANDLTSISSNDRAIIDTFFKDEDMDDKNSSQLDDENRLSSLDDEDLAIAGS